MPRKTGTSASVYISSTKILDTFEWEFEDNLEVAEATVIGETYNRYMPVGGNGRVRAQRYVQTTLLFTDKVQTHIADGLPVDFELRGLDAGGGGTVIGQGYLIRGRINASRQGLITDELEIQVDGTPTTVA